MAGPEIKFVGAVYDPNVVKPLRFHARAYIHGHTVGGTNPSLVEALAAGNAIIAHDNRFTRWVVGDGGRYFKNVDDLDRVLSELEARPDMLREMQGASRRQHIDYFKSERVLLAYEKLLWKHRGENIAGQSEGSLLIDRALSQLEIQEEDVPSPADEWSKPQNISP